MIILVLFAFLGGIVTILSPCILPILPIILAGSVSGGKKKPYGIVLGFVLSFTFFTLFLSTIVNLFSISADSLRYLSIFILIIFGLTLIVPQMRGLMERAISKFSSKVGSQGQRQGFGGGLLIGLSLGLLWTPCVGPILASVISLALTGQVTGGAFIITLAYSLGTALPMLAIIYGGRQLLNKVPWLLHNSHNIQKAFGVIMITTALLITFNIDRQFQTYILKKFPSYGSALTSLEDNNLIQEKLDEIMDKKENNNSINLAPEIQAGGQWFNSKPLTLAELKGKVVLLDFMTYSCINCIRTFPYLQAWHEAYQEDGLVVIGIHSPEFEFEKNPDNVAKALKDFGLTFAVVQDNDFATWQAYQNRYWPHTFLINHQGKIVYDHIGEGNYDKTEAKIRELLSEKNAQLDPMVFNSISTDKPQGQSPEVYFGARRNSLLGNGTPGQAGIINFDYPEKIEPNTLYLVGQWRLGSEYAESISTDAKVIFKYKAKKIFMVAGSLNAIDVSISQDGQVIKSITIQEEKLYELIDNQESGLHTIEISPQSPGLQAFTFTFG